MPTCCRTCDHRNAALHAFPYAPSQLEVCIVTLNFRHSIVSTHTAASVALNTFLNDIVDSSDSVPNPSTFTVWSPCVSDPSTIAIITTAGEICNTVASPIFDTVRRHLNRAPSIQHVFLDRTALSLAASSPEQQIPIDMLQLYAPSSDIAVATGKLFGWDPKRSSLSSQLLARAPAAFSRPGDLVRDFWAWAELPHRYPATPSLSAGSCETLPSSSPVLVNTNSEEKNMSLPFPDEDDDAPPPYVDDEVLIMMFQWSTRVDGERFKDQNQRSFGTNGEEVRSDMWTSQVAEPVARLQQLGARLESYQLELRGVEPRLSDEEAAAILASAATRERSGSKSKRLSMMASELGGRFSGLWK